MSQPKIDPYKDVIPAITHAICEGLKKDIKYLEVLDNAKPEYDKKTGHVSCIRGKGVKIILPQPLFDTFVQLYKVAGEGERKILLEKLKGEGGLYWQNKKTGFFTKTTETTLKFPKLLKVVHVGEEVARDDIRVSDILRGVLSEEIATVGCEDSNVKKIVDRLKRHHPHVSAITPVLSEFKPIRVGEVCDAIKKVVGKDTSKLKDPKTDIRSQVLKAMVGLMVVEEPKASGKNQDQKVPLPLASKTITTSFQSPPPPLVVPNSDELPAQEVVENPVRPQKRPTNGKKRNQNNTVIGRGEIRNKRQQGYVPQPSESEITGSQSALTSPSTSSLSTNSLSMTSLSMTSLDTDNMPSPTSSRQLPSPVQPMSREQYSVLNSVLKNSELKLPIPRKDIPVTVGSLEGLANGFIPQPAKNSSSSTYTPRPRNELFKHDEDLFPKKSWMEYEGQKDKEGVPAAGPAPEQKTGNDTRPNVNTVCLNYSPTIWQMVYALSNLYEGEMCRDEEKIFKDYLKEKKPQDLGEFAKNKLRGQLSNYIISKQLTEAEESRKKISEYILDILLEMIREYNNDPTTSILPAPNSIQELANWDISKLGYKKNDKELVLGEVTSLGMVGMAWYLFQQQRNGEKEHAEGKLNNELFSSCLEDEKTALNTVNTGWCQKAMALPSFALPQKEWSK